MMFEIFFNLQKGAVKKEYKNFEYVNSFLWDTMNGIRAKWSWSECITQKTK